MSRWKSTLAVYMSSSLDIKNLPDGVMKRKKCLSDQRCVSMPSVASSPVEHRSRMLRLQDRRFRHRFPQVPPCDRLLNYFSCALVSDILLQGHLFITKNHLAFYSNIFGHKTQILILIGSVVKVTKEKIAKIIPNAVGVYTESDKYVFGSLLSRDTAFRVIQQTWKHASDPGIVLPDSTDSEASPTTLMLLDDESSVSSSASGGSRVGVCGEVLATPSSAATTPDVVVAPPPIPRVSDTPLKKRPPPTTPQLASCTLRFAKVYMIKIDETVKELLQLSRTSLFFMVSTILLVVLFISTTVLLYRIHLLHQKLKDDFYSSSFTSFERVPSLLPTDITSVVKGLEERIQSLAEVRSTLEKLLTMANSAQQVPPSTYSQNVT